jgi:TATA-box binding protein (TBP) (component of TFIID and TFIIIB)
MVRIMEVCQLEGERVVRIIFAWGKAVISSGTKQAAGMSVIA